jgi:A/G-specific adenine glycosylase
VASFRKTVWAFYEIHGRSLPWRDTSDPYLILVSEFMLQQTQVSRVLLKYAEFIQRFPDLPALAAAPLDLVLTTWSGLGYNRRALWLKRIADTIQRDNSGQLPRSLSGLRALPGVGPATAAAVATFAYGQAHPFLETNIRTAIWHHFPVLVGPQGATPSDRDILGVVDATLDRGDPRNWFYALMDYGSSLKKHGAPLSRRQGGRLEPYAGSRRALRSAVLRVLLEAPGATRAELAAELIRAERWGSVGSAAGVHGRLDGVLAALVAEGFLTTEGGRYRIAHT